MSRKIIKIIVEDDVPPCEFKDAEELRWYCETHQESKEIPISWTESLKMFKRFGIKEK